MNDILHGVRSLGFRTDLLLVSFDGVIRDRGEYLVVETPTNRTFHWGNLLLFRDAPGPGDRVRWPALFQQEMAHAPEVRHMTLAWDAQAQGDVALFLEAGFRLESFVTLTADRVHPPPRPNADVAIRPLESEAEWEAVIEGHVAGRDSAFDAEGYERFVRRQMARYRALIAAGWGQWFGAFLGDRLVADLGLFVRDGVGRFQLVSTHPDFQRRGICGTLVHHVASLGLHTMGATQLVMIADEGYHAARIYESVGFRATERLFGLSWWRNGSLPPEAEGGCGEPEGGLSSGP